MWRILSVNLHDCLFRRFPIKVTFTISFFESSISLTYSWMPIYETFLGESIGQKSHILAQISMFVAFMVKFWTKKSRILACDCNKKSFFMFLRLLNFLFSCQRVQTSTQRPFFSSIENFPTNLQYKSVSVKSNATKLISFIFITFNFKSRFSFGSYRNFWKKS